MTVRKFQGFLHYREIIEELKDLWRPKSFRIHWYSSVVDPGEGLRGPLFLDKTEARRVEKNFFETAAPLSQGLDDCTPLPLSEGLDLPLFMPFVYFTHHFERSTVISPPNHFATKEIATKKSTRHSLITP